MMMLYVGLMHVICSNSTYLRRLMLGGVCDAKNSALVHRAGSLDKFENLKKFIERKSTGLS